MNTAQDRSQRNWRRMLEWSSDPAALVHYESSQLLKSLLGERTLDTATQHNVALVGQLLVIVCEPDSPYDTAADTAVKTMGSFLEFLVRCFNTRGTPQLVDVECTVVRVLYNLAGMVQPSPATQEQVAPYVPFLLHAAFVQLKTLKNSQVEVFGLPPRMLADDDKLYEEDQFVTLATALLPLVAPAYFTQLLGFKRDVASDTQVQLAYIYERLHLSVFYLGRSLERLYATPLGLKPANKKECAEPKVMPKKVLSFLNLCDQDTELSPPSDYTTEEDQSAPWEYEHAAVEQQSRLLLHHLESLQDVLYTAFPAEVFESGHAAASHSPAGHMRIPDFNRAGKCDPVAVGAYTRCLPLQVKLVAGTLHWLLVTMLACISNLVPIGDSSPLITLWRRTCLDLVHTITLFGRGFRILPADEAQLLTVQLFKGTLYAITIDQAFAAYHPQGSLDTRPLPVPSGTILDEILASSRPCSHPLLHLLAHCNSATLYAAFGGCVEEKGAPAHPSGARPPLELSIATFLHSVFTTHFGVSQRSPAGRERQAATAMPVQNIFRGIHVVLSEVMSTSVWTEIFTSSGTRTSRNVLAPNWLKATEICKGFSKLPFGQEVSPSQVESVSQNAWMLVHYYFQLSIPCAPTAPPSQVSGLRGKGWDDYDEYFVEIEKQQMAVEEERASRAGGAALAAALPQDFGIDDGPGDQGYRLRQLLSSHLRGILTVIPYFRILFVINKRDCNLEQCAYYCSSLADLIGFSAHNHGVSVPFLRTYVQAAKAKTHPHTHTHTHTGRWNATNPSKASTPCPRLTSWRRFSWSCVICPARLWSRTTRLSW